MTQIIEKINSLGPIIVSKVTKAINERTKEAGLDHYEIVWRQLQQIATDEIKELLEKTFPGCVIVIPKSKSTYPDIKLIHEGHAYAIDIKSNEAQKNPWFDMARLDTIHEKRLDVYREEWELIIMYDSETKKFLKTYFMLFREAVGYNSKCKGVKYRPYDGKLRPKSWEDFENNVVYWKSKKEFMEGISNSRLHRIKYLIKTYWLSHLSEKDKKELIRLLS